ncbi:MAG: FHA domain-containing protein, partial [Candidatus Melainabacteria bacterium]|nr:FHA domain-containing protein [Candidatus Melainabacteria bacterium]
QEHFKDFGLHYNGQEVHLPGTAEPTLRLGRNPIASELSFDDAYVSREHANITASDGKVFITNLRDSNKTTIVRNGVEIPVAQHPAKTELLPGDTIRLGKYTEMEWMRSSELKDAGKPRLYRPQPGMLDVAAEEGARRESNAYLRNHEYAKPFPNGFQNVGGSNLIDATGEHHDPERPSVVLDQRPGADPALERFVKEMKEKYAHLTGDPASLAEALAREAKAALEPKGWSPSAVDDGYSKLRSDFAGKRMLLGDFLEAAKYSKGAGVCNHQAMLTKVAFDNFYPADQPNRPEMKMVRGFYGDSPKGLPRDMVQNHAWNTLTIPNRDGSPGQERIYDPRQQIYGDPLQARPDHHAGKDIPQMRPADQVPKPLDLKQSPLTAPEIERLKGQEVQYNGKKFRIQNVEGGLVTVTADGLRNVDQTSLSEHNPEAAKSGRWVVGQEYNVKRSSGEVEKGWTLIGVIDKDGQKEFVLTKPDSLTRKLLLSDVQKQNSQVFEEVQKQRAAQQAAFEKPGGAQPLNRESHGFVAGREVLHLGERWTVQGQNGSDIEITRPAVKEVRPGAFEALNGKETPRIGENYLVRRGSGQIESWRLTDIDPNSGMLTLRSETGFKERVSLERLAEQNRSVVGPLDVGKVLADPRSKVHLICRWTDGDSGHDKWIATVEGPNGERVSAMVHKPPHGNPQDWLRAKNDMAAQELAKFMKSPELFPSTVMRDGMMVQAFIGNQGENIATYLHDRSRQDGALRAQEPHLDKRIEKLLDKDPVLRQRVAEGVAFSLLLGDHDHHGLNFVINRDGAGPNDFHIARIDTDYAFSKEKTPNMNQAGNFGSVVNGAFTHLSQGEIPKDVRAKIQGVSDQLSTKEGREAFQKATNLSMDRVEALASRAKTMAESGRFPRSMTVQEQNAEMGSVRGRANAIGEVVETEKIGTVKALDSADLKTSVDRLRKLKPQLEQTMRKAAELEKKSRTGDGAEYDIYRVLNEELDKLKQENRIDRAWELFPSDKNSPADKAGCDVLMVNTKTGEIQMIDFTKDPTKDNISEIRRDGVILFDKKNWNDDIETFRKERSSQLELLAGKETPLKLGGPDPCPFPDLIYNKDMKVTAKELEAFEAWSRRQAQARSIDSPSERRLLINLAEVVHQAAHSAGKEGQEVKSRVLQSKVQSLAQREIVDLALSTLTKEELKPLAGTAKSEVKIHADQIKVDTKGDGIHITDKMTDILQAANRAVMDEKVVRDIISKRSGLIGKLLTPNEQRRLGITPDNLADIDSPKTKNQALRDKALLEVAKKVRDVVITQKDITAVDGGGKYAKAGTITERVAARLRSVDVDEILDRPKPVATPPAVETPKPAEAPKPAAKYESLLNARAEELAREYLAEAKALTKPGEGKNPSAQQALEWLLALQEDPDSKSWSDKEIAELKTLADGYKAGEPAAVEAVNKMLSKAVDSATGTTARAAGIAPVLPSETAVEEGPRRPKRGAAPTPERISGGQQHANNDGTMTRGREVVGSIVAGEKLSEGDRVAQNEIDGMKKERVALEQKEKDNKIDKDEKLRLEALRYAEQRLNDPAFQKELKGRARRGMAAGEISGALSGVAILTAAALGFYLSLNKSEQYENPDRAKIGG